MVSIDDSETGQMVLLPPLDDDIGVIPWAIGTGTSTSGSSDLIKLHDPHFSHFVSCSFSICSYIFV